MPPRGSQQSEEAKQKIRLARAKQASPLIGQYGITTKIYEEAKARGLKWCRDCKQFIPPEWFYGNDPRCIECGKKRSQAFRDRLTPEQRRLRAEGFKKWREDNQLTVKERRDRQLRKRYGVTAEWYDNKLAEQGGGCAICEVKTQAGCDFLSVDHDHKTGEPRGILCRRCNVMLGKLERLMDQVPRDEAMRYLEGS